MTNNKRPIDQAVEESYSWWGKSFVFIKKTKIKTWHGIFIIAFMTGTAVTLSWTISNNWHPFSSAMDNTSSYQQIASISVSANNETYTTGETVDGSIVLRNKTGFKGEVTFSGTIYEGTSKVILKSPIITTKVKTGRNEYKLSDLFGSIVIPSGYEGMYRIEVIASAGSCNSCKWKASDWFRIKVELNACGNGICESGESVACQKDCPNGVEIIVDNSVSVVKREPVKNISGLLSGISSHTPDILIKNLNLPFFRLGICPPLEQIERYQKSLDIDSLEIVLSFWWIYGCASPNSWDSDKKEQVGEKCGINIDDYGLIKFPTPSSPSDYYEYYYELMPFQNLCLWEEWVKVIVNYVIENGIKFDYWDIWNEPEFTWIPRGGTVENFIETSVIASNVIHNLYAKSGMSVMVGGPTIGIEGENDYLERMEKFMYPYLEGMARKGAKLDVVTWHDPSSKPWFIPLNQEKIKNKVLELKTMGHDLGVVEYQINEIVSERFPYSPAESLGYFKYLQEAGIKNSAKACWGDDDCIKLMDGLLYNETTPKAVYWFWKEYGDRKGVDLPVISSASPYIVGLSNKEPDGVLKTFIGLHHPDLGSQIDPVEATLKIKGLEGSYHCDILEFSDGSDGRAGLPVSIYSSEVSAKDAVVSLPIHLKREYVVMIKLTP